MNIAHPCDNITDETEVAQCWADNAAADPWTACFASDAGKAWQECWDAGMPAFDACWAELDGTQGGSTDGSDIDYSAGGSDIDYGKSMQDLIDGSAPGADGGPPPPMTSGDWSSDMDALIASGQSGADAGTGGPTDGDWGASMDALTGGV